MLLEAPTLLFSLYLPLPSRAIETAAIENSRGTRRVRSRPWRKKKRKILSSRVYFLLHSSRCSHRRRAIIMCVNARLLIHVVISECVVRSSSCHRNVERLFIIRVLEHPVTGDALKFVIAELTCEPFCTGKVTAGRHDKKGRRRGCYFCVPDATILCAIMSRKREGRQFWRLKESSSVY